MGIIGLFQLTAGNCYEKYTFDGEIIMNYNFSVRQTLTYAKCPSNMTYELESLQHILV